MKRFVYLSLFLAGMFFASSNVAIAQNQDTKAKTACCQKAAAGANMKNPNCPMAAKSNCIKTNCPKDCPMAGKKECPMATGKNCSKANSPMKKGTANNKKASIPEAEAKMK
jgi:hypothetical protein